MWSMRFRASRFPSLFVKKLVRPFDRLGFITNDSGPLQLAAALAVPSVSIFGPTDPGRTVIPGATHVIRKQIGCGPCYQKECPLRHHLCMTKISVDEVYAAAIAMCN